MSCGARTWMSALAAGLASLAVVRPALADGSLSPDPARVEALLVGLGAGVLAVVFALVALVRWLGRRPARARPASEVSSRTDRTDR